MNKKLATAIKNMLDNTAFECSFDVTVSGDNETRCVHIVQLDGEPGDAGDKYRSVRDCVLGFLNLDGGLCEMYYEHAYHELVPQIGTVEFLKLFKNWTRCRVTDERM